MKKILAYILILLVVLIYPINAFAAEPTFAVSSVEARAGQSVDVTIKMVNNPGIASVKLKVSYDSALTLTGVTYNNASLGGQSQAPQKLTSPVTLNWFNGAEDTHGDMVYATLSFTVAKDATEGDKAITVTYNPDDVYNSDFTNVNFAVSNGKVTVKKGSAIFALGDISGDSLINATDLSMLLSLYGTKNPSADITGDGVVNASDLSKLLSNYGTRMN